MSIRSSREQKNRFLVYGTGAAICAIVCFWVYFFQPDSEKRVINGLDLSGLMLGVLCTAVSVHSFYSVRKISRTYPVMVALLRGEKGILAHLFDLEMDGMAVLSFLEEEKHYLLEKYLDYVRLRYSKGVKELKSIPVVGEDEYSEPYPSRIIGKAKELQKIELLPSYRRGKKKQKMANDSPKESWFPPFQFSLRPKWWPAKVRQMLENKVTK